MTETPNTNTGNGTVTEAMKNLQDVAEKAATMPPVPRTIQLPEDDAELAKEAQGKLVELQCQLGEEAERHRMIELDLLQQISNQRREISSLAQTLAKKHVKDAGHYNLVPEIGAFVEVAQRPPASAAVTEDSQ
jgi:hypothetical protein